MKAPVSPKTARDAEILCCFGTSSVTLQRNRYWSQPPPSPLGARPRLTDRIRALPRPTSIRLHQRKKKRNEGQVKAQVVCELWLRQVSESEGRRFLAGFRPA